MRGLAKALIGFGVPLLAFAAVLYFLGLRSGRQPAPPQLTVGSGPGEIGDPARASPDGDWVLDPDRSFVGYRIVERNPSRFTDDEVVGRTDAVEGWLHVDGDVVTSAKIVADARRLRSDRSLRDRAIRSRYLESNTYPEATFRLTTPVDLSPGPVPNEIFERSVNGELTLHGVTRRVEMPVEARWSGSIVEVIGVVPVDLADYGIVPPRLPGFRLVQDHGDVEFRLTYVRPRASP